MSSSPIKKSKSSSNQHSYQTIRSDEESSSFSIDSVGGHDDISKKISKTSIDSSNDAFDRSSNSHYIVNYILTIRDQYFRCLSFRMLIFLLIIAVGISIYLTSSFLYNLFESSEPSGVRTYDYIIIGGGPAGSVITRKLVDRFYLLYLFESMK
jgi:hypothetical protein